LRTARIRGPNVTLAKAETTLLRDGQRGQRFPFEIKIVNLWTNDKGKLVGVPVAVEPERVAALGAVDDTDDDATLTPPDTPADKLAATLRVFRECVEDLSNTTGEPVSKIGVTAKALNRAADGWVAGA
jgi:hypothetical protein